MARARTVCVTVLEGDGKPPRVTASEVDVATVVAVAHQLEECAADYAQLTPLGYATLAGDLFRAVGEEP